MSRTTSSGGIASGVNATRPFVTRNPGRRSRTRSLISGANTNRLRCAFAALNPSSGRPRHRKAGAP